MDIYSLKNILKFISTIGVALSLFLLLPISVGLFYGENMSAFALFNLALFCINIFIYIILKDHEMNLRIRDGIFSVNLIWILIGIAGAIPFLLYTNASPYDAFFESISGFTTTGATIFTNIEALPKSILFLRSLTHWLGGMGIIVLGVGLFSLINPSGSMTLFKAESTGIQMEKITPKVKDTALLLWGIYILFTFVDAYALKIAGMSMFDAINHAMSTISTGGFSTKNASLGYYDSNAIVWITTFFMIISGINFLAHLQLFSSRSLQGYKRLEVRWYLFIFIILSTILTFVIIYVDKEEVFHSIAHASFSVASVLTTTGFVTLDYERWGHIAIAVIFLAMLIGGNAGSTAGGVKVIRYLVLFRTTIAEYKRILNPNVVVNVFIDNKKVSPKVISATTGFIFLFGMFNILIALYLFGRGYDAMTSVSTALATIGNIGPGFSLTGPVQNYAFFSDLDKSVLSFAMIIGRLEFYTVVLMFSKSFWKKF
ncbi:Potassium uptake protein TrkH [hydrothermal vent metagenome]|uniref:Potassium uptake protein TrkH n=1 Tax=hydrothermal vent metagenome TaxID=652676 RepID=A0A1W1EG83_9ZZZZ